MGKVDKEKSCQYCSDRFPGCHSQCEFYERRTENNKRMKEDIRKQKEADREIQDTYYKAFGSNKRRRY